MSRRPIRTTIRTHTDPPDESALDAALRDGLARWASGVTVLAASDGEEVDAITVSAFSAVSLDPPLVLACVGEQTSVLPMVIEQGRFTVSVLAEDQRRIAIGVAQRDPGALAPFRTEGDPVLEGALVSFICRLWSDYAGGDHRILVGEVERVEFGPEKAPLLYYRRGYTSLGK